ncbi:hypothetical protein KIW84_035565 [Lathyrus oleraceus]|uniref:Uncharacterized protein n=1 Tax=Pisum sativum TaxID=3888 RepID=A0A9D5B657_PEA|nr:hypothetical protein KIW84_035565 [Pisum sativum]
MIGNAVSTPNPALVVKPSSTSRTPASVGPSGNMKEDCDEILKLIKRSEYNVVDQLLQTPSKISVLSLLLNSEPHREALQKVLDVAYVDHDVTIEQFDSIVANITACNNLSFCDSDLPEEGRDHNNLYNKCEKGSLGVPRMFWSIRASRIPRAFVAAGFMLLASRWKQKPLWDCVTWIESRRVALRNSLGYGFGSLAVAMFVASYVANHSAIKFLQDSFVIA